MNHLFVIIRVSMILKVQQPQNQKKHLRKKFPQMV